MRELKPNDIYDQPIEIQTGAVRMCTQQGMDGFILKIVQQVGIDIDKEGLVEALNQDRRRYAQAYRHGYNEGYKKAKEDLEKENIENREALAKIKRMLSTR